MKKTLFICGSPFLKDNSIQIYFSPYHEFNYAINHTKAIVAPAVNGHITYWLGILKACAIKSHMK